MAMQRVVGVHQVSGHQYMAHLLPIMGHMVLLIPMMISFLLQSFGGNSVTTNFRLDLTVEQAISFLITLGLVITYFGYLRHDSNALELERTLREYGIIYGDILSWNLQLKEGPRLRPSKTKSGSSTHPVACEGPSSISD